MRHCGCVHVRTAIIPDPSPPKCVEIQITFNWNLLRLSISGVDGTHSLSDGSPCAQTHLDPLVKIQYYTI